VADGNIVKAHLQHETEEHDEVIPEHVDREVADQSVFDAAKRFLTRAYGGKRCIVCEMRGETPKDHIESHHIFEWCHWNDNDMGMVEVVLRALSPFVHGLYMVSKEDILAGERIPSLWEHPELVHKPFKSLDDPRNQFFLCHAHHQQSTKEQIAAGYDVIGIHHVAWTIWLQYLGMRTGKVPVLHAKHHDDGLDRRV
jgi:hypothetical protein